MPIYVFECMAIVQSRLLDINLQWKIHINTVAERAQRAVTSENTCKQNKHQQIKKTSS